jgi:hypothetical protein
MVQQVNRPELVGGAMLSDQQEWLAYVQRLMQQQGMNPYRNMYAQRIASRAGEGQYLANLMNVGEGGVQDFANQWLRARLGQGGAYGGTDLSRQGLAQWLQQAQRNNDPNSPLYAALNTGDPAADYKNLQAMQGMIYGGESPMYQQARARTLDEWYGQARAGMQQQAEQNPGASNTNILDWFLNRQAAAPPSINAPPGSEPTGGTGATPTNPPTTVPPNPATPPTGATPTTPPTTPTTPAAYNFAPSAGRQQFFTDVGSGNAWGEVQNWDQWLANQNQHITAPGRGSVDLGNQWAYIAPQDVARRGWTGATGAGEGASGWRLLTDRMRGLMAQGMSYGQALQNALDWIQREAARSGQNVNRYGFARIGG